jgi:hypothetical protein
MTANTTASHTAETAVAPPPGYPAAAGDTLLDPQGGGLTPLLLRMAGTLLQNWRQRTGYQTVLYAVSVVMLASGIFHTVVFLVSGTSWDGPVSWRKPLLFGYSFGVTTLALAWIMTFLPRRRVLGWVLAPSLGAASFIEVGLITMQRWRGVPSHFNAATTFDSLVFIFMGAMVTVVAAVIVAITIWSFIEVNAPPTLRLAIRAGLVLLIIGQGLGGVLVEVGVSQTIGPASADTVFGPQGVMLGAAGVLKEPHGIALHAIQVLLLLAWLMLFTSWTERGRLTIVAAATVGYSLLLLVIAGQAFSGHFALDLNPLTLGALAASVALLVGAYGAAVFGLLRSLLGPTTSS